MKIGRAESKHGLMLAPMAGYTDGAMRKVCYMQGAEWCVTEMVSAKAVTFGDKKTFALAKIGPDESPCSVQIFGSEPDVMAKAAERLSLGEEGGKLPDAIDVNMGCPVNKIFGNGEGSALMRDPDLIYRIVGAVSQNTPLPVTVKLRAGIDSASKNAVECALAAESAGASAVKVHGRTRAEMYSGKADLEIIKSVKDSVKIPVIANGDVTDAQSALFTLKHTGADGIMVGRGAIGNPFVFSEIKAALEGKSYTPPTIEEKIRTALLQLRLTIEEKGEEIAVRESRKQIALYLRSFSGAARIRAAINIADSYAAVEAALLSALD